jgi:hypothetical protein
MKETQRRRADATARLEHLDGQAQEGFDVSEWLEQTRELLKDLRFTLESAPVAGRHVLRGLLAGPITVTPTH